MRALFLSLAATTILAGIAQAEPAIMPLDRATILAGSPFDFKIELDQVHAAAEVAVTVNGQPYATVFGKPATSGEWGWSFEGHHFSLNFVVRDGSGNIVRAPQVESDLPPPQE